jgi:hypothetical protein
MRVQCLRFKVIWNAKIIIFSFLKISDICKTKSGLYFHPTIIFISNIYSVFVLLSIRCFFVSFSGRITQFTLRTWLQFLCLKQNIYWRWIWSLDGNKDRSSSGNELWSDQDSSWRVTSFSFRFTFHYFPFNSRLKICFP